MIIVYKIMLIWHNRLRITQSLKGLYFIIELHQIKPIPVKNYTIQTYGKTDFTNNKIRLENN